MVLLLMMTKGTTSLMSVSAPAGGLTPAKGAFNVNPQWCKGGAYYAPPYTKETPFAGVRGCTLGVRGGCTSAGR